MWAATRGMWGQRAGLGALLGCSHSRLPPACARGLHGSPIPCGKNLLKKFASKTKKKFWYEGPSLGAYLAPRPHPLAALAKGTSRKTRKDDHVRLRALNGLLHKALNDLLCTPEVSQELCDLAVELSRVSLTADFSACRVYWRATLSTEHNTRTEAALQRSAPQIRHLLMSRQILRNMPPIVFLQDKGSAALAQVDHLLKVADFGPPEEQDTLQSSLGDTKASRPLDFPDSVTQPWLCGIDHEALSKQVAAYRSRRARGTEAAGQADQANSEEQWDPGLHGR